MAGEIGDLAVEDPQLLGDDPADPPEPDDADLPAGDAAGQRRIALAHPAAVAHVAVVGDEPACRREEQHDGEIGHVVVQHVGRVGDPHAALSRMLDVDGVGADAEGADDLEIWQGVDQACRSAMWLVAMPRMRPDRPQERRAVGGFMQLVQSIALLKAFHDVRHQLAIDENVRLHRGSSAAERPDFVRRLRNRTAMRR